MGGEPGTLLARAGHEATFSYARSKEKLNRLAREAGAKARAGTSHEAAQAADAILLAVHWLRIDDVLSQAGDLPGKVIVSCSLPLNAGLASEAGVRPRLFIHQRCGRLAETLPTLQRDPSRPEDVLKVDADEEGVGGDDAADALRYMGATKSRIVVQRKLRGL